MTILIRPFQASSLEDTILEKNGRHELESALFAALGRAQDLKIRFTDPEDLAYMATETAAQQRRAAFVSGPVPRKIVITEHEHDYEIGTSYIKTASSPQVRIDANVFQFKGGVQVASLPAVVDTSKDLDPLGPLGKDLVAAFRHLMGLPPVTLLKIHVPCFGIEGDVTDPFLKQMRMLARNSASAELFEHATLLPEQNCDDRKATQGSDGRELYLKGTITVHIKIDKQSGQQVVVYFLLLGLFRGEQPLGAPPTAQCDEEHLMDTAQTLGREITKMVERPGFQDILESD